jgi:hypothetical protein
MPPIPAQPRPPWLLPSLGLPSSAAATVEATISLRAAAGMAKARRPADGGLAPDAAAEEPKGSALRIDGPSGVLRVWLGGPGDRSALEADVRAVSDRGIRRLPALAVAFGDVARQRNLEVRVIPRIDADGRSVLVIFGKRSNRAR